MLYPFRVYKTKFEEHEFWVAESTVLKGCVGQGDTLEEALAEYESNEKEWLDTAKKFGVKIPDVQAESISHVSGKFTVRVSPTVHQEAVELAKISGISLNQYVNDAIVTQNARLSTIGFLYPEINKDSGINAVVRDGN